MQNEKLKVGVFFTGFLRTYLRYHHVFNSQIFSKYDCDIKYCLWNRHEGPPNSSLRVPNQNNFGEHVSDEEMRFLRDFGEARVIDINHYTATKKQFQALDRPGDVFKVDKRAMAHGDYFANRIIDQWFLIKEGFRMFENPQSYDVIIRLRFDAPTYSLPLIINECLNVPADIGGWEFTDHMAYGNPEIMETYSNLHEQIGGLYRDYNIDVSHAVNLPLFYIRSKSIIINTDEKIKYSINKR